MTPPPDTRIGKTLAGKFLVRKLIGRGGMGAVYEGTHVEIGKRVAIKLIDPQHARSEDIANRFRQEARAASRVESDHIVQVFDVGTDSEHGLYMVMEYLTGEDVATRLDREGRLDVKVAVDIAYQAARGLAKAHGAGVIHRDLKPANIFLSARDDGLLTVKLVDFGISKVIAADQAERDDPKRPITRLGSAVGTPQYMSPEQAQGQPIDHRTDVWALGCCLYEMLSGKQAYEQLETYEQTIFAIVLKKPKSLAEIASHVPDSIADIVYRALEHDLELRIPDCGTFAKLLYEALPEMPGRATSRTKATHDAPSRILRPAELPNFTPGPHPDAIVIPAGQSEPPPAGDRMHSTMAATQPLANAVSPSSIRSGTPPHGRHSPPTVAGVSVKSAELSALDADASLEGLDESPPPRRRGGRFLVALMLVTIVGAVGGAALLQQQRRGTSPASSGNDHGGGALTTPVDDITKSSTSGASSVNATTTPATPTIAPLASTKSSTKSTGKIGVKPIGGAPSAKPSASVSAAPSGTSDDGQFGGTGVSSAY